MQTAYNAKSILPHFLRGLGCLILEFLVFIFFNYSTNLGKIGYASSV